MIFYRIHREGQSRAFARLLPKERENRPLGLFASRIESLSIGRKLLVRNQRNSLSQINRGEKVHVVQVAMRLVRVNSINR